MQFYRFIPAETIILQVMTFLCAICPCIGEICIYKNCSSIKTVTSECSFMLSGQAQLMFQECLSNLNQLIMIPGNLSINIFSTDFNLYCKKATSMDTPTCTCLLLNKSVIVQFTTFRSLILCTTFWNIRITDMARF